MSRTRKMLMMTSVLWLLFGLSSAVVLHGLKEDHNQPDVILDPKTFGGVANLSTFLLDNSSGLLFIGARDAILSVDTNRMDIQPRRITWDVPEKLRSECMMKGKEEADCHNYIRLLEFVGDGRIYVCGTYAFDPQCAFLSVSDFMLEKSEDGEVKIETGRRKCPFDPNQRYTAVMADGILYPGVSSNFLATQFQISRATGPRDERIRTEESYKWLNKPEFVGSALIQESVDNNPTGEDDKIYYFFTEVAKEYNFYTEVKVPRVARVCRADMGGRYVLHRRWTTFLKAPLVCEDKPRGRRYNVLTDVFAMEHIAGDPSTTHFYGLFTSQWEQEFTAVCVFSLSDIIEVMDGPFTELTDTGKTFLDSNTVPKPRPGKCLNNALKTEGFNSSFDLPSRTLYFKRSHNLMENSPTAAPLLVRKGTSYTKLAVTQMEGKPGRVLVHLGTDRGELHQVEVAGYDITLLREIPLFASDEPVNNLLLHMGKALVGSPKSLARVQADGCALYPDSELCASAAVGCVWNATMKACTDTPAKPGPGEAIKDTLRKQAERCSPTPKELNVSMGLCLLLSCQQLSARPCSWEHPPHRHTRQHFSDLEVSVDEESLGRYVCTCQEVGLGGRDLTPCRRAVYDLKLMDPNAGEKKVVAQGPDAFAPGHDANAPSHGAIDLGPHANAPGHGAIVLGHDALASGRNAIASGHAAIHFYVLYLFCATVISVFFTL